MASAKTIRLGIWLGRILSPKAGYFVADWAARALSAHTNAHEVTALRQNLRVVFGADVPDSQLSHATRLAFRNSARAYYDLYRAVALGPEAIRASVEFTDRARTVIDTYFGKGRGVMVVTGHYGNFDLGGLAYSLLGIPTQILSWPNPRQDYRAQNDIRMLLGFDVTPLSLPALKKAVQTLRQGGIVATAVDRPPPPGSGELLSFFGQPARLPVGHVRLAQQANAYLAVAHCRKHPTRPHIYLLDFEVPIEIEPSGDRKQTMITYASRILSTLENHIRQYPEQWYMFHPVWEQT